MSLYIVKFHEYSDEVKIGKSRRVKQRIEDHCEDHGSVEWVEEYSKPDADDGATEKMLLSRFREQRPGETPTEKRQRRGWTEFVPAEAVNAIRQNLAAEGYTRTDFSVEAVASRRQRAANPVLLRARKALDDLEVIDAIIMTPWLCEEEFPSSMAAFEDMCSRHSIEPFITKAFWEAAQTLQPRYPDGILKAIPQ